MWFLIIILTIVLFIAYICLNRFLQHRRMMQADLLKIGYKDRFKRVSIYDSKERVWMTEINIYDNNGILNRIISVERPDIESMGISYIHKERSILDLLKYISVISELPSKISKYIDIVYSTYSGTLRYKVLVNNKEIKSPEHLTYYDFRISVIESLIEDGILDNSELNC